MEENFYVLLAAALMSLLFFYVPGFKGWYEKQSPEMKQLIMLFLIFAVTGIDYAMRIYQGKVVFGWDSVFEALALFFVALSVNAGVYRGVRYIGGGGAQG